MTTGEMIKEIYNSTQSKSIPIVGSIQGNGTIDISGTYSDYKNLSKTDFIISITSLTSIGTTNISTSNVGGVNGQYFSAGGLAPNIEYNNETGILTLTGLLQYVTISCWKGTNNAVAQTASANIYVNK